MTIRVNMTADEAKSEFPPPIPEGNYHVAITDCDLAEVRGGDNKGKPMFKMECTVQNGPYEDRKVRTNVMLFEGKSGTLAKLAQLLKAVGVAVVPDGSLGKFQVDGYEPNEVPDPEWWIGREMIARVKITKTRTVKDPTTGEETTYDPRNDVQTYLPLSVGVSTPTTSAPASKPSLLP